MNSNIILFEYKSNDEIDNDTFICINLENNKSL